MAYTCCVLKCKSGYQSVKTTEKVPLFKFPIDVTLKESWKRAIPCKDWTLTDSHRVCSKHFKENDFMRVSADSKTNRQNARESQELIRLRLKPTAVPTIFPDLPNYMSKPTPKPQPTSASTASARFNAENDRIKQQNLELLRQDAIENFASVKSKLKELVLPSGYVTVMKDKVVEFRNIELLPDETTAPKLLTGLPQKLQNQIPGLSRTFLGHFPGLFQDCFF